jgi:putative acetyltransferase
MRGSSSIEIRGADIDEVVASGLLRELDDELMSRYPGSPVFGIDGLQAALAQVYFVIARSDADVIGCGAFRPFDSGCVEIKRMFVRPAYRGRGVARHILQSLHAEARSRGYAFAILETGMRQPEAIALYESEGYQQMELFGPYVGNALSVCFRRKL